ncbi:hypothetical protein [Campylobacter fetus]|uniref:hypothetical protein n=1 Tax=Campylobacter fetus TaxID=196 RepID=UPI00138DDD01|nr:hypothetical protein [Campylobacter fetus]
MKVVLLNDNPAVSRLVNVSLAKLGYEFIEVADTDSINGVDYDLLICDSALFDENSNYSLYAKDILYLVPRNYENISGKNVLEKPFLPTDFIDIVENILKKPLPYMGDKTDDLNLKNHKKDIDDEDNVKLGNEFGELRDIDDIDFSKHLNDELLDTNSLDDELLDNFDHIDDNEILDKQPIDKEMSSNKFVDDLASNPNDQDFDNEQKDSAQDDEIIPSSEEDYEVEDSIQEITQDELEDTIKETEDTTNIDNMSNFNDESNLKNDTISKMNYESNLEDDTTISSENLNLDNDEKEELTEIKSDELDELSSMIQEIDNMPIDDIDKAEKEDEYMDLDEQSSDITSIDEALKEIDNIDESENLDEEQNSTETEKQSENLDNDLEEFSDDIIETENLDKSIDEIQNSVDTDHIDESSTSSLDEITDDSEVKNLDEFEEHSDEADVLTNEMLVNESDNDEFGDASKNAIADEAPLQNDAVYDENVSQESANINGYEATNIDEISEKDIKTALNEEVSQSLDDVKETPVSKIIDDGELKSELTKKISEQITESLNSSAIKDLLKDMNIKINISFEEKA